MGIFAVTRTQEAGTRLLQCKKGFSLAAVRRLSGAEVLMRNKEATDLFDEVMITVACDIKNAAIQGQARVGQEGAPGGYSTAGSPAMFVLGSFFSALKDEWGSHCERGDSAGTSTLYEYDTTDLQDPYAACGETA